MEDTAISTAREEAAPGLTIDVEGPQRYLGEYNCLKVRLCGAREDMYNIYVSRPIRAPYVYIRHSYTM